MEAFPFSDQQWSEVLEAARAVVNAGLAEDSVLRASHFVGLQDILASLRASCGDHPLLLETEADLSDDPSMRITLYRQATRAAELARLPTLSIRISLARVLIEDFNDAEPAMRELLACEQELSEWADESDRREWSDLRRTCNQALDNR